MIRLANGCFDDSGFAVNLTAPGRLATSAAFCQRRLWGQVDSLHMRRPPCFE
jgi:hypothetical protein